MKIFNRGNIFWLLSSVISLLLSGGLLLSIGYYRDYRKIPPDHSIGNRTSSVNAFKEGGLPFSFLVIGDTHNSGRAERLIRMALKGSNEAFMVILGDFVNTPDIWQHRFFLTEVAVKIKPPFPVFLIPGDHDIAYRSFKGGKMERTVTPEVYESLYGSRNFDFVFNDCLFILCGVNLKNRTDYLDYLRDTLSRKGSGKRRIFVFVHYPPKGLAGHIKGLLPNGEEFFSLLEAYRVTTCFFGDHHGYWRGQRKGVNLIVSGGGGRFKNYQPEWGKFHHILRVSVDENKVSEEVMTLGTKMDFENRFEEMVFTKIFPIVGNSAWVLYALLLVFLSWGVYSVIISVQDFRRK